jgi:hypothetical protein
MPHEYTKAKEMYDIPAEARKGPGLALGLRHGPRAGFGYGRVAQIIFGFSLFQLLSDVIQNISSSSGHFTAKKVICVHKLMTSHKITAESNLILFVLRTRRVPDWYQGERRSCITIS